MMSDILIPEWQAAEGEDCMECGEPCFLRELRFSVLVAGVPTKSNIVLCQSCGEIFMAPDAEPEVERWNE